MKKSKESDVEEGGEQSAHFLREKCASMGAFGASDLPWGLKGIGAHF
jgi:hypothetical protein